MFMKLYPALLLPIFLIILYNRGQRMEAARQFAIFAVLSVLIMVPFVLMASGNAWNFLEYHSDRGLQIESVAASLILLADLFGLTSTSWNNSFGSFNLGGDLADSVAEIMMPLMIVVILLAYVLYFRKTDVEKGNDDGSGLVAAVALVVLLFVVFNKVFSAQYVIWIMLAVLPLCFFTSPRFSRTICLYVLLMMVLTYCMEEFYDDLMNVESTGIAFLFIRNVLVVIMTAHIFHEAGYIDTIRGWLHRTQDS